MQNFEKYKTAKERTNAFKNFCDLYKECQGCPLAEKAIRENTYCSYLWLDLDKETPQWQENIVNKFTRKD